MAVPIALALGPLILAAVVLRNWHGWAPAAYWLDDLAAAAVLIGAGVLAYSEQDSLRGRLLSGALAFAVAVLWGSILEVPAGLHPVPEAWTVFPTVAGALTGVALALAIVGLICSLPSKRRPFIGTRPEKQKTRR